MLVGSHTTELPWIDIILDILVKRVLEFLTFKEIDSMHHQSILIVSGVQLANNQEKVLPKMLIKFQLSMLPKLDFSKFWEKAFYLPNQSLLKQNFSVKQLSEKQKLQEAHAFQPVDLLNNLIQMLNQSPPIKLNTFNLQFPLIIFKIYIISMKKTQKQSSKSKNNKKKDYYDLLSHNKKQFELLYRERDAQPSPQCYQSIIFLKSKKVNNKQGQSKQKGDNKNKNNQIQELKQMMNQLQKKVKKTNRTFDQNMKNFALKSTCSTTNNFFNNKKNKEYKPAKKENILSVDNVKKYKEMLSPSKRMLNSKENPYKKANIQSLKKVKGHKKSKEIQVSNLKTFEKEDQTEQYIVLQNNFLQINEEYANILTEKINLNQKNRKSKNNNNNKQLSLFSSLKSSQEISNNYNAYRYIQKFSNPQSKKTIQKSLSSDNLELIQQYVISKVITIQRWWKNIFLKLQKQRKKNNIIKKLDQTMRKYQLQQGDSEENNESFVFQQQQFENQIMMSPIKAVDKINQQSKTNSIFGIQLRQKAARKHYEIYSKLLQELWNKKQISQQIYNQKKNIIESKYNIQLTQISQITKIIKFNQQKILKMQQKLKIDIMTVESTQNKIDLQIIDQIFGENYFKNSQNKQYKNQKIINRQKSTGCHFNYKQKNKISMYQKGTNIQAQPSIDNLDKQIQKQKQEEQQQQYQQDFEDEYNQNKLQNNNKQQNDNATNEIMTKNYEQFLQECKFRQQLKLQMDKRIAVQMGMLIQIIPDQIIITYYGINTSLNNIHNFLVSFFKFYIFYYKDQFLRLINMPFGQHIKKRLQNMQGNHNQTQSSIQLAQDDDGIIYGMTNVINNEALNQFYQKVYQLNHHELSEKQINTLAVEKIHNKALFDSFNMNLNSFRPYSLINGAPYPWTCSEKSLTFYYIAEQNIQEVFQKTQFKVLKQASSLCGLMINRIIAANPEIKPDANLQQIQQFYLQSNHPCINQLRQERLIKSEKLQIIQRYHQWQFFDEQITLTQLQIAEVIYNEIIIDLTLDLARMGSEYVDKINSLNSSELYSSFEE